MVVNSMYDKVIILNDEDKKYFDEGVYKLIVNDGFNEGGVEIVVLDKDGKRLYSVYGYTKK